MTDRPFSRSAFDRDERDALDAVGWEPGRHRGQAGCPDPALLLAATEGLLDEAAAEPLRRHLGTCRVCSMLVVDLASVMDEDPTAEARDRIRAPLPIAPFTRRRGAVAWWIPSAALLSAAAVLVIVINTPTVLPTIPTPPIPSAAAALALPTVFTADVPSASAAGDLELLVRGGAQAIASRNPVDEQLAQAASLIRDGHAPGALPVLEKVRALATNGQIEEVELLLAVAYVRTGADDRARALLEPRCPRNTWFGALACAGLLELDHRSASR